MLHDCSSIKCGAFVSSSSFKLISHFLQMATKCKTKYVYILVISSLQLVIKKNSVLKISLVLCILSLIKHDQFFGSPDRHTNDAEVLWI